MLHSKRSHHQEKAVHRSEAQPPLATKMSPHKAKKTQHKPKIKNNQFLKELSDTCKTTEQLKSLNWGLTT